MNHVTGIFTHRKSIPNDRTSELWCLVTLFTGHSFLIENVFYLENLETHRNSTCECGWARVCAR